MSRLDLSEDTGQLCLLGTTLASTSNDERYCTHSVCRILILAFATDVHRSFKSYERPETS